MITVGFTLDLTHPDGSTPQVSQDRAYVTAIENAGAAPLVIPPLRSETALRRLYDACDALVLPGGRDVDPALYSQEPHPRTKPIAALAEQTELTLLQWALDEGMPLLLICRGMQLLNVHLGGTLHQHLADDPIAHNQPLVADPVHGITLHPESEFARIAGTTTLDVNSSHHQSIARLADGLIVTARADDGVIEALEMPAHPYLVAVQFHPEVMTTGHPWAGALFSDLVTAAQGAVPA